MAKDIPLTHGGSQDLHLGRAGKALSLHSYRTMLTRWTIIALIAISTAVPWYTLRLVPVMTFGAAKVNVLDVLVAVAVLLAAPEMIHALRRGPRSVWWVWAFTGYMFTFPLVNGLRDGHQTAFFAIREARPIAFYALALALAAMAYTGRDFRLYAAVYVGGTAVGVLVVLLHFFGYWTLPGYPEHAAAPVWWGVHYLEATVPIVAFLLALIGAVLARSLGALFTSVVACLLIVWYALASTERFTFALIIGLAVIVPALAWLRGQRPRRGVAIAVLLAVVAVAVSQAGIGPALIRNPVRVSLERWSRVFSDDSLGFRRKELASGLRQVAAHPLVGGGLGTTVLHEDPDHRNVPWPYVSVGYGYLLIRAGIIGLLLYAGMIVAALRVGLRNAHLRTAAEWPAGAVGVLGVGTLLTLNVLYPAVDTPEGVIAFSLFYGMIMAGDSGVRGSSTPSEAERVPKGLAQD